MQVLLAQWMLAKALEQVMAAVKAFHQANQTAAASAPQLDASVQQPPPALKPHLWLQCRLQVGCLVITPWPLLCDTLLVLPLQPTARAQLLTKVIVCFAWWLICCRTDKSTQAFAHS